MKYFLTLLLFFCAVSTDAFAAKQMRDMSLSPEETSRQSSTTNTRSSNTDTGFDSSVEIDPNMARQLRDLKQQEARGMNNPTVDAIPAPPGSSERTTFDIDRPIGNQRSFMSSFCSNASQSCQNPQQEAACERFQHATVAVQRLLDRAISCEYNATGLSADCDGLDAGRLDLLKQYWQDEDASYTILFLPDIVLNAAAKCSGVKSGIGR